MSVFVVDKRKRPLMPCSEKRARLLLARGRARVHRRYPFTIRLIDRTVEESELQPVEIKVDPGSKTSGFAVVRRGCEGKPDVVLHLAELTHRGQEISESLMARAGMRRRRRGVLRYRSARSANRTRSDAWLAPSLRHRVETTVSWVLRLRRVAPLAGIAMELVRFDTQAMENPEISGVEYQRGTLAGTEAREYLLAKWGRTCAYCGARNVPLNIDHIVPRARGGSNRISNLTLACIPCNTEKCAQPIETFVKDGVRLARITNGAKATLKGASAVNATRWVLLGALKATGLAVRCGSGGRTKWNRTRLGVTKTHALDAACVGECDGLERWRVPTLSIRCTGRGAYQRTRLDRFGFPRGYLMRSKSAFGFKTGDIVRASILKGARKGTYEGRVAIRARGSFNVQTPTGVIQGVSWKHCALINRGDGYAYQRRDHAYAAN